MNFSWIVLLPSGGTHICILVLIDSLEIEGLIVDEELCTGDCDGTNSHRQRVVIHITTLRFELNLCKPQLTCQTSKSADWASAILILRTFIRSYIY